MIRNKRCLWIASAVAVFLIGGFWGLWQIDMVRQTIRITFLDLTGRIWKIHGRTETHMMPSRALGQTRQVIVYLPPGYDDIGNRNRRYPVVYLLHGFPGPADGWVRFGLAPQLVDQAIVKGDLPPLIVVMPDSHGALGSFGDSEYLNAPAGGGRPGTRLADYIVDDIPRWTDHQYRTIPTAQGRFLAGSSTGGYAALNLGLKHPETFGTLIALSGYFHADLAHLGRPLWGLHPDPARIRQESPLDFVPIEHRPAWHDQFVYLGNGLSDYKFISDQTAQLTDELNTEHVPVVHHRMPGHHEWDLWRLIFVDGLEAVKPRLEAAADSQKPAAEQPLPAERTAP